jgi:threonine dehydratase
MSASKLVVEFSGAATVAALLSGAVQPAARTVAILSGGNLDPVRFGAMVAQPVAVQAI